MTASDRFVAAIDQGTTSTRCVVVDAAGRFVGVDQREHTQGLPRPGWVEHDAVEIWRNTEAVIAGSLASAGVDASQIVAVGITNQRETTVAWDAQGDPLAPAIVWQDTRTADLCRRIGGDEGPSRFQEMTGLPLATYFAGPKMTWLTENVPAVRDAAAQGDLRLGTMDAWLLHKLTGRFVTDVTNASRTMLMSLRDLAWDDELMDAFGVTRPSLPEIVPSIGRIAVISDGPLAGVPVSGILGDQQAALFGHGGFEPGDIKNTYGTGCFMLLNTGDRPLPSASGLLTTVAYQVAGESPRYALEGSVAVAGSAVQWLRDNLGLIDTAPEVEALAGTVADNGDVYFVPAFSGLFAPRWRPDARGVLAGMTRYTNSGHFARAVLESVAYQTKDVVDAMEIDGGLSVGSLKVDGGMVGNDLLMQFQADVLGVPVIRPSNVETTVLGAAYAAGIAEGFWDGFGDVTRRWERDVTFTPAMDRERRETLIAGWNKAVERSLGWVEG